MTKSPKAIGILGGMGPYASAHFYKLMLDKSRAYHHGFNNNYPEIVIDSIPVPDFISSPSNMNKARKILIDRVERLNVFKPAVMGMVCNTAHILYPELNQVSCGKFISIIKAVATKVKSLGMKKIGLLATPTTIRSNLYSQEFAKINIQLVYSNHQNQKFHEFLIRKAISGQKIGQSELDMLTISTKQFMYLHGLDGIVLACTELPLFFPKSKFNQTIDCLDVLADSLILNYYKQKELL